MKTLNYLFFSLFSICMIAACDVNRADVQPQDSILGPQAITSGVNEDGLLSKPFKATFFTETKADEVGINPEECPTPPFNFFNVQVGSGEATHLGQFTVRITFCVDITDFSDDGTLTGDESAPYNNGIGTFIAANGDELHFTISGVIVPTDNPNYDFEFQDPFDLTGGTGRFEGATGGGLTDSFHDQSTQITDHKWTGELIFPKF